MNFLTQNAPNNRRYLLEAGAKVNAQTSTGDTALTYACENGHTEVADLLLKYGAELEHESEGGRTPLMKAARAGHLLTVSFLLKQGAEVNRATANNDHTPLSLACAGGHQGVVETLLQHGADPFHKLKVRNRLEFIIYTLNYLCSIYTCLYRNWP